MSRESSNFFFTRQTPSDSPFNPAHEALIGNKQEALAMRQHPLNVNLFLTLSTCISAKRVVSKQALSHLPHNLGSCHERHLLRVNAVCGHLKSTNWQCCWNTRKNVFALLLRKQTRKKCPPVCIHVMHGAESPKPVLCHDWARSCIELRCRASAGCFALLSRSAHEPQVYFRLCVFTFYKVRY